MGGRWITRTRGTGARWRDGLRAMRQGWAMQAPSRSRTPGANGRTSGTVCETKGGAHVAKGVKTRWIARRPGAQLM